MMLSELLQIFRVEIGLVVLLVFLFVLKLTPTLHSEKNTAGLLFLPAMVLLLLFLPGLWHQEALLLKGAYRLDRFSVVLKGLFLSAGFLVGFMAQEDAWIKVRQHEFYMLLTTALLGASFLASANDFLTLFISIELSTISLYVLTAYFRTDGHSLEASVKYLTMGAFSAAILLYGISFLYGWTGSFSFDDFKTMVHQTPNPGPLFYAGVFFVIAGLGFKIAAFPFQLWAPDVYEGSPTPVTAFLTSVSKTMGFGALIRILFGCLPESPWNWSSFLALLAAATLLYGNLGAIPQIKGNLKRLMGFSSIAHSGYLLIGIASGSILGMKAILFYLAAYFSAALPIFLGLCALSNLMKDARVSSLQGLSERSPFIAAVFFISFLSLAGIPPLSGFFAKFLILQAIVEKGMIWLALLGAINVVISLYYYLSVVRVMYIEKPEADDRIPITPKMQAALGLLAGLTTLFGVFQSPLVSLISQTIR